MESLSPFLQGSFIPYNMPVYPGAQRIVAYARKCQLVSTPEIPACGKCAGLLKVYGTIGSWHLYRGGFPIRKNQGQFTIVGLALARHDHLNNPMLRVPLRL